MRDEYKAYFDRKDDIAEWCIIHNIKLYNIEEDDRSLSVFTPFIVVVSSEEERLLFEIGYEKFNDRSIKCRVKR